MSNGSSSRTGNPLVVADEHWPEETTVIVPDTAPPPTLIRRIGPADLDLVVDLFLAYLAFYESPGTPGAVRDFLHARLTRDESIVLVACRDGAPVGFTQVYPTFSSVSMAPVWVLNDLYVHPGARSCGVGRALIHAVSAAATDAGAVRVALETADTNTSARALYESEGFTTGDDVRHYVKQLR